MGCCSEGSQGKTLSTVELLEEGKEEEHCNSNIVNSIISA
jgi:hypothetical protein